MTLVVIGLAIALIYPLSHGSAAGAVAVTVVVGVVVGAALMFLPPPRRGIVGLVVVIGGGLVVSGAEQVLAISWVGAVFTGVGLGSELAELRRLRE